MTPAAEVHCSNCEYDLRGLPRGGVIRCPECGTTVNLLAPREWRADPRFLPLVFAPGVLCAWVTPGMNARMVLCAVPLIVFGLLWAATYGLLNGRQLSFLEPWKRIMTAFCLTFVLIPLQALMFFVTLMILPTDWLPMV